MSFKDFMAPFAPGLEFVQRGQGKHPDAHIFGVIEQRPILHWRSEKNRIGEVRAIETWVDPDDGSKAKREVIRKLADQLCVLEWESPADPIAWPRVQAMALNAFVIKLRDKWVKTRRRCPVCKKRVNRIEIPLYLNPWHPQYEQARRTKKMVQDTLSQLDTFKKAVEAEGRFTDALETMHNTVSKGGNPLRLQSRGDVSDAYRRGSTEASKRPGTSTTGNDGPAAD
jgi:hypothetical protein